MDKNNATQITSNIDNVNDSHNNSNNNILNFGQMKVSDVYSLTRDFIKSKEGSKAIIISYNDRNMMYALVNQVHYGQYREDKKEIGFLDLVGKDRLQVWKTLGNLSKEDAMKRYIELVTKTCPLFYPYFEAHKSQLEEAEQNKLK
jgi:acyl-CoA-binding protein